MSTPPLLAPMLSLTAWRMSSLARPKPVTTSTRRCAAEAGARLMGSAAASVESVRLDPDLSEALRHQAEKEGRTNSEVIRDALRRYLKRAG